MDTQRLHVLVIGFKKKYLEELHASEGRTVNY
jgi:hypothetical protein